MKFEDVGIFFDRDGTINTEVDFLRNPDDLELIPEAGRAIREANELGVKVFVITNQSGIARGILTEADLKAVHERLIALLDREGAKVDEIYFCPHHAEFGFPPYNVVCDCRKPKAGMLLQAANKYRLRLADSFVVGDRFVDMKAGESAGCGTVLVLTGYGTAEREECIAKARVDHVAADMYRAWGYIRKQLMQRQHNSPPRRAH